MTDIIQIHKANLYDLTYCARGNFYKPIVVSVVKLNRCTLGMRVVQYVLSVDEYDVSD